MNPPGHRPQPTATPAGQPHPTDRTELLKLAGEVDDALAAAIAEEKHHTSYRDHQPVPAYGTTPPVPQPGRAPMSQDAVDYSARILSTAVASVLFSASGSGLLIASNHANPTTLGLMIAAPAVLAVPILALKSLMKSAKHVAEATPPTINQHYNGPIYQDNRQQHLHTRTQGVIAYTRNQPELPANSSHTPR